jgi:hypothetical protein
MLMFGTSVVRAGIAEAWSGIFFSLSMGFSLACSYKVVWVFTQCLALPRRKAANFVKVAYDITLQVTSSDFYHFLLVILSL